MKISIGKYVLFETKKEKPITKRITKFDSEPTYSIEVDKNDVHLPFRAVVKYCNGCKNTVSDWKSSVGAVEKDIEDHKKAWTLKKQEIDSIEERAKNSNYKIEPYKNEVIW